MQQLNIKKLPNVSFSVEKIKTIPKFCIDLKRFLEIEKVKTDVGRSATLKRGVFNYYD